MLRNLRGDDDIDPLARIGFAPATTTPSWYVHRQFKDILDAKFKLCYDVVETIIDISNTKRHDDSTRDARSLLRMKEQRLAEVNQNVLCVRLRKKIDWRF